MFKDPGRVTPFIAKIYRYTIVCDEFVTITLDGVTTLTDEDTDVVILGGNVVNVSCW